MENNTKCNNRPWSARAEHPLTSHQRAGGQRAQSHADFADAGEGTRINGPLTKKLRAEMGQSMHRPEGAHRQDWVLPPHAPTNLLSPVERPFLDLGRLDETWEEFQKPETKFAFGQSRAGEQQTFLDRMFLM